MTEHNVLTGGQLHEPKGVATALIDQVYTANGSGSGAWSIVSPEFTNLKEVISVADLPTPVGGVITLEADTAYFISGAVDITPNVISISNAGSALLGFNRASDALITNVALPLISSTNQNVVMQGFTLLNLHAAGTLVNFGNSGTNVVIFDKMVFSDCLSIGVVGDFQNIIFDNCAVNATGSVGGVLFTGTAHTELMIRDSFFKDWVGTLFDLGTSESMFVTCDGVRFLGTAGAIAIDGLPNAGNIAPGGIGGLINSSFIGMTNPLGSNIDHADSGWFFSGTVGIQESAFLGYMSMTNNSTDTIISSTNEYTKVAGTTVAFADNERFTMSASNELTANLILPRPVVIDVSVSSLKSGGGTDRIEFTIFKDTGSGFVQMNTDVVSGRDTSTSLGSLAITANDTALPGDKYALYAQNTTSTSNLEITDLQFRIRG